MKQTYFFIFLLLMNCNNKSETHLFTSNFGYTILLPENWAEYEDEENTDAFFDTIQWTGNLRITPMTIKKENQKDFLDDIAAELNGKFSRFETKNGFNGIKYQEEHDEDCIYFWCLSKDNRLFICSFTINAENKNSEKNKKEIEKVTAILTSVEIKQ